MPNTYTAQPEVVEAVQYAAPRGDDVEGNVAELKAFYTDGEVLEQPGFDPHGSGTCLQLHHGAGPHDAREGGWSLLADGDWLVRHVSGPRDLSDVSDFYVATGADFAEAFPSAAPAPAAPGLNKIADPANQSASAKAPRAASTLPASDTPSTA